ncbi:protein of unknown function [Acidithiobacillus ferrivorans]|uniref:Uncharacterized protein n=1 Tax=Acidithiobacillus ferrivorans TaxID=160808 RepID=A0A060UZZ4_9PROT|nr:hypothetical protein AFERRI_600210 [Acidithiobacillus ferrivorans]SMH65539.1 protein of unknown function [Acidithiobacillus ferrivorans]
MRSCLFSCIPGIGPRQLHLNTLDDAPAQRNACSTHLQYRTALARAMDHADIGAPADTEHAHALLHAAAAGDIAYSGAVAQFKISYEQGWIH